MSALLKHAAAPNSQKRSSFTPSRRRSLTVVRSSTTPRSESLRPETAVPPSGAARREGAARRDFRSFRAGSLMNKRWVSIRWSGMRRVSAAVRSPSDGWMMLFSVTALSNNQCLSVSHAASSQQLHARDKHATTRRGDVRPPLQARRQTVLNKCETFRWGSAFILGFFFGLRGGFFFRVSSTDPPPSPSSLFLASLSPFLPPFPPLPSPSSCL